MSWYPTNTAIDDNNVIPDRSHPRRFLWIITFAVAVLVEQLTNSVLLAAVTPCAHAGWKTLRCAYWLKLSDPITSRGWACFFFYVATACWKIAGAALLTGILCYSVAENAGQKPPEDILAILLKIMAAGGCLTALFGICAIVTAFFNKVRVWVNPSVYDISQGNFSNILYVLLYPQQLNQAIVALGIAVFLPIMGAGTVLLIYGTTNCAPADMANSFTSWIGLLMLLLGPFVMIPVFAFFTDRIIARSPIQCWTPTIINDSHP